jgi:hypothetical protein
MVGIIINLHKNILPIFHGTERKKLDLFHFLLHIFKMVEIISIFGIISNNNFWEYVLNSKSEFIQWCRISKA